MNVFATYPDPVRCAAVLDDQRVVKMMTESMQILAAALHNHRAWVSGLPRPTHTGHPVVVWAGAGRENAEWLWEHALALEAEWLWRYDHAETRRHKTIAGAVAVKLPKLFRAFPRGFTPHVNCAANTSLGISFKHVQDTHKAYRMYLTARWRLQQDNFPAARLPVATFNLNRPRPHSQGDAHEVQAHRSDARQAPSLVRRLDASC